MHFERYELPFTKLQDKRDLLHFRFRFFIQIASNRNCEVVVYSLNSSQSDSLLKSLCLTATAPSLAWDEGFEYS